MSTTHAQPIVADLGRVRCVGDGAQWSLPHRGELDANLVTLQPGHSIDEHVNDLVDVLMFVQSGSGEVTIDGTRHAAGTDHLVLVPRGASRSITAGDAGITYLSVHRLRDPLTIESDR